jgi:signal transduction histidine kinase/PAS domain-containing protein
VQRPSKTVAILAALAAAVLLMALASTRVLTPLFSSAYLPHRFCYLAQPGLIWSNVVTDALIAVSYIAIFASLFWISARPRRVTEFAAYRWIFLAFGLFIIACAATHLMEIVTVWWPLYPLSAAVKLLCAAASVPTAVLFTLAAPSLAAKIPEVLHLLPELERERDHAVSELLIIEQANLQRAQAEAETAAAHARLNHILESTSEGIFKIAFDWSIPYANRVALAILPDLRVGSNYWECFPAVRGTFIEQHLLRAMNDRVVTGWENFWEPYNEWYDVHAFPAEGGISIFFVPITEHKKMERKLQQELSLRIEREQALEEAHTMLNHILDSTSESVMKIGRDWTILYGNRNLRERIPHLRVGADFWDVFPAQVSPHAPENLRKAMDERIRTEYETFYPPTSDWFRVCVYPTEGGITMFSSAITEQKNLERELEHERTLREKRIEALSNMAGGLAHEISNPLAIIHGVASDLLRHVGDPEGLAIEDIRKAGESIVNTADRASRILRGLRGFAREGGKDPKEFASIDDIVEQAIQMQEARFARHEIELRVALDPGLPLILCREVQIGQILTNLLNNAFDALVEQNCPERWVQVAVRQLDQSLQIDVTDSGLGIDEDARKHLMEPFFTTKTRGLGMGVGLSLSRAIATEHGGTLELSQDRIHTCFRLTLPLLHEDSPAPMAHSGEFQ